ncbi:hypothetical protein EUGRSUZ_A01181, partial [Eucalyptus grandis]
KEGGLNAIETYVFWNAHEPLYRQYDFEGNKDLVRFIKTIQDAGLHAILRIGPYVCAEWNYGGFPVWLHNLPGVELRTNNTVYQGGPIIVARIENEYENVEWAYGNNGNYGVQVPWIMCQQSDAPSPMMNTCNGYYCDQFSPNNPKSPKWWTENWSGWFKDWGMKDPHRTAEDLAFAVARFFQYGGSLQNYYMYHGGTNFDRTAGGPYITTSYDYDAPLDEYGNLNQTKWGHLKRLHELIMSMEEILTHGVKRDVDYGNMMSGTVYMYKGKQSCFLGNANQNQDFTVNLMGSSHTVPAWSVSILPDCYTEVYNTAKINSQQTVMVKLPNEADDQTEPYELKWDWRPEHLESLHHGVAKGSAMTANELLDQKTVTNDTSDYLWYLTSLDLSKNDSLAGKVITLHVHTNGHIVHAFVNGKHVGESSSHLYNLHLIRLIDVKYSNRYHIKLKHGKTNWISLLSVTVGLQILFVWYKTTFKAPLGSDPWWWTWQRHCLGQWPQHGRFWPSYVASEDGCIATYDYCGAYKSDKCLTNCGKPSQRWYHIPCSFLQDDGNKLVLFEEFGGTPLHVRFQTVTAGTICATTDEKMKLELSCQDGRVMSEIKFASFSEPIGVYGSYARGSCEAPNTLSVIQKQCLGQKSCTLDVSENTFGPTGCHQNVSFSIDFISLVSF